MDVHGLEGHKTLLGQAAHRTALALERNTIEHAGCVLTWAGGSRDIVFVSAAENDAMLCLGSSCERGVAGGDDARRQRT
jgi:hypothetical protein